MDGHAMPQPLFEEGDVSISESEATFGDRRYAIAAIRGADIRRPIAYASGLYASGFLLSTGMVGMVIALFDPSTSNGLGGPVGACLAIALVGLVLTAAQLLRPFKLTLRTAEGVATAYASFNPSKLEAIHRALNRALAHRA